MPAAIRSVFSASVALAGAGVITASPVLAPSVVAVPTIQTPAITLTAASVPALGAIPYQVAINQLANVLALAPIVVGSTEQCITCLGPVPVIPGSTAIPFTGWGAIGIGVGLLTSPFAFAETLSSTSDLVQALGVAGLAVQTPITNTLALLEAGRDPFGGFELQGVLDRAFIALKHTIDYTVNIAAQALVTGPLTVIGGVVIGLQTFVGTLAATGDIVAAFNAGRIPVRTAVTESLAALADESQEARATIYTDLTAGPAIASPIPTVPPPTAAAERPQPAAAAVAGVTAVENAPTAAPDHTAGERTTPAPRTPKPVATDAVAVAGQAAGDAVAPARTAATRAGAAVRDAAGGPKRTRAAANR
jgi:hypothetical protein